MRSWLVLLGSSTLLCALAYGCGGSTDDTPKNPGFTDAGKTDALADTRRDGSLGGDSAFGDTSEPDAPPPIDDTGESTDFGPPPDGSRVEGVIGASGGTLAGAVGTPLAGVVLTVPAGALASDVTFALDVAAGTSPPAGTLLSPVVRVGPEGTLFAKPARLTLPYATGLSSPQLAMVARIGFDWSSLLDPSGDPTAKTLTASMTRASVAGAIALDLTSVAPTITGKSGGFLSGAGFGFAQVWRAGADGGADFVSRVTVAGVTVPVLAWSDDTIAIAPSDGGTIIVTTPGGSATAP